MKDYNCANCGVSVFTDTYEFECPECSYVNDSVDHIYRLEEIQDNFKNEQRRADHLYDETQNLADRLRSRDAECARLCRFLDDAGIDYQIEGEE